MGFNSEFKGLIYWKIEFYLRYSYSQLQLQAILRYVLEGPLITEVSYILCPTKLCFKIILKLITFKLRLLSVLLHTGTDKYILYT